MPHIKPEIFNGTSISAGHIGDAANESLNQLQLVITVAAEAPANNVTTTIQVLDANGENLKEVVRLHWRLHDTEMIESLVGAFTSTPTTGTVVSTDDQPALVFDTDATGLAILDTDDVATGTAETLFAIVEFLGRPGRSALATLVFV